MRSLVWFRGKDLRVADHGPLWEAARTGEVLPLFVLDPFFFAPERAAGLPHRMQLLLEGIAELDRSLRTLGSRLLLVTGRSVEVVPDLARRWRVDRVLAHRWSEPIGVERDRRVALGLGPIPFERFEGETLVPPGSLRTGQGGPFRVFTPFARAFTREGDPGRSLPAPSSLPPVPGLEGADSVLPSLRDLGLARNPNLLPGGEGAARARLMDFCAAGLEAYERDRDRMDLPGTSRLSQDLHFGFLSPRQAWLAASGSGNGARAFRNELLWREFAHHLLVEEPSLLSEPFRRAFGGFPWRHDEAAWTAWCQGRTGYPVVDAAARQLLSEGFVHNRARMVAASFLAKHLLLDYRLGEAHYLRWLADGDWACNNLGWQWSAGCGVDAQPWFRVFNPVAQGRRFDPAGDYVRRWVPELDRLADRWIHAPWEAPASVLAQAGVRLGATYPAPIVEHAEARSRFLATAKAALRGDGETGI